MIKLLKPRHDIYLVTATTLAELGRMFVRPQEFYESPSRRFRGRYFRLKDFKRWYIKREGRWSYYQDYQGYNIPGESFLDWQKAFAGNETVEEANLLCLLGALPPKFYLIGVLERDANTVEHELHHAFFHLDAWYRNRVATEVVYAGESLRELRRELRRLCYDQKVVDDECAAYLLFERAWMRSHGVSSKRLAALRAHLWVLYRNERETLAPGGSW